MASVPRISVKQAAEEKGCAVQTVYLALGRGDLDEERIDRMRLVKANKRYREWEVKQTGGRTHRRHQAAEVAGEAD